MLFNSWIFAIFLIIVFALYWILPHRWRWLLLLVASYYFYMSWDARYIVLILFTTLVSWLAGLGLKRIDAKCDISGASAALKLAVEAAATDAEVAVADAEAKATFLKKQKAKRCWLLVITLVVSLGVLFFFKYFNWLSGSFVEVLNAMAIPLHPLTLKLLLPVGISFYTFQTLSYVIDVYKGQMEAETHFGYYATYIAFFPQLVAGPIERASNILPQLREERHFSHNQAIMGVQQMAWGFFKKIVVADTLAKGVDVVYASPTEYTGLVLVVATVMFAIQIYCDFSGYSDIALGVAKLLGIELMMNFNSPYFSASVKEFWSRWHISLSTWFRDYIYIPLGGSRCSACRRDFNLMVTFVISGLWHGANWTFIIWGFLHGAVQVLEKRLQTSIAPGLGSWRGWKRVLSIIVVFAFVSFAWIFFRAYTLSDALYICLHGFSGILHPATYFASFVQELVITPVGCLVIGIEIVILWAVDYLRVKGTTPSQINQRLANAKPYVRYPLYVVALCLIAFLAVKGTSAQFIYFQF